MKVIERVESIIQKPQTPLAPEVTKDMFNEFKNMFIAYKDSNDKAVAALREKEGKDF